MQESRYRIDDNTELRRLLVENVPDTFRWLMALGVEFYGPLPEPPHRRPRMHNVLPNSRAYIYHLGRAARRAGVQIVTSVRAQRLLLEGESVVGVACEAAQGPVEYRARGGVVLTTGDFSGDPVMRTEHLAEGFEEIQPVNPANTGDGHKMVLELGGRIVHTGIHSAGIRFQPPPPKWITALPPQRIFMRPVNWAMEHLPAWLLRPVVMSFLTCILVPSPKLFRAGAVLINARGERFLDELANPSDSSSPVLARQPEKLAYVLLDGKLAEKFSEWPNYVSTAPGFAYAFVPDYRRTRKDIFHEAPTLEALAGKLGMPAGTLEENRGRLQRGARFAHRCGGTPAARPRTLRRHGPGAALSQFQRQRRGGRCPAARAWARGQADSRALCGGLHRHGRHAARRTRPPHWMGVHLGPDRGS